MKPDIYIIMSRILKLDDYEKSSPSIYGLEADGTCYELNSDIKMQVITGYSEPDKTADLKFREPNWESMVAKPGDILVVSNSCCYIIPKGNEGYMECRPEPRGGSQEPSFDRFDTADLTTIGKGLYRCHSLPFDVRKKITTATIL